MTRETRLPYIKKIQELRGGRILVSLMNFDRHSVPTIQGLNSIFDSQVKEPLFRVLKESIKNNEGIDLFLYTRGGEINAVWPIVNLIREFDPDFCVLVPFRCHSAGTLVALGAKNIVMGMISELSPIDPTTGNRFNPSDARDANSKLGISVEDVQAYRDFLLEQFKISTDSGNGNDTEGWRHLIQPLWAQLVGEVHPLALGNVHRVSKQIEKLAKRLLAFHEKDGEDIEKTVKSLTTHFYSHIHMIDRHESKEILGDRVEFAEAPLNSAMDDLLGQYKKDFLLWKPFFLSPEMGDEPEKTCKFVAGVTETSEWSYLLRTDIKVLQHSKLPSTINLQLPAGQKLPLISGLPREYPLEIVSQGWERNEEPRGVTK